MLYWLVLVVHVIVSLILIATVLLQTGKRADLAGAFGGGGSQTAFGPRGASNFLSKATTISAVVFMVTSLSLAILSSRREVGGAGSVLDKVPGPTAPASPVPQGSAPPATPPPAPAPEAEQQPSGK
jgi:preprotein translocase subunit SecG